MRAERAFTLLEVMAAVAILGLIYTALARSTSLGIMSEADSRRRLEASLLADEQLHELELQLASGYAPELGEREPLVLDDLTVRTSVTPWVAPTELVTAIFPSGPVPDAPSIFGGPSPTQIGLIRVVRVQVSWLDGAEERHIERVTYGFDAAEATELGGAALLAPGDAPQLTGEALPRPGENP